ncbi:VOC family protein [Devosia sp. Leaf64]|uniref:VOC family protein n=1 Tax=Devosia sp. Leaf64 TaxID=1736229 RepID=UPI000715A078|nr:VOC family protein [Devosia sp. Leaf64]KQN72834.1 drug:proton antiporter [Devosia sp. Leaf64]
MRILNYILLAVADIAGSRAFYSPILGIEPVEASPTFLLYVLPNGIKLGFWIAKEIEPTPRAAGGVEVTFSEENDAAVDATFADWSGKAEVLQQPTRMDFGYTFVVADPDGHRLRVFTPAARPR